MKKFLVTILALVYLSVSSGATISMHYCMGKLMAWELQETRNTACGTCGMEKSSHKGCCKDEQKKLQIDKDQKISESSFHFLKITPEAMNFHSRSFFYSSLFSINYPLAHGPPALTTVPIFIRNCNFRI